MISKLVSTCLICSSLAGCNYLTYYKELEADKRLAIVTEKQEFNGTTAYTRKITCSEPSPDALTALAASLSGETKAGVNVAAAYAENAASIGLRTQSIQLLRDQLYSICQAYANEGLSSYSYQTLLAKNQQNTIALMAIEQLTGVIKSPNVKITTRAESYASGLVNKQNKVTEMEAELADQEDKKSEKSQELKKTIDALKKDLKDTQRSQSNASGDVRVEQAETPESVGQTQTNITTITDAILKLVATTNASLENVNSMFVCTDILQTSGFRGKAQNAAKDMYTPLEKACEDYVNQRLKTEISRLEIEAKVYATANPTKVLAKPDEFTKAIEAVTTPTRTTSQDQ